MSFIEEEQEGTVLQQQQQQEGKESAAPSSNLAGEQEGLDEADDLLVNELDYRSAHLSSFMEAVRSAAQARNRASSFLGVSAARVAAEVGVPLQATFSVGGTAR